MFGSLGDLAGLMKQAKQMQSKMKEMQETLANTRFEADSGAGAVTATVSGKLELVGLKISPSAVTDDIELLEDLVKSAVAAAQRKANEGVKAQMQQITGGMNLPGLEGMLGGQ